MSKDLGRRVAVCLLTYNHVDVVESTLATILDQTLEGHEIIVSDDSSTDGTWELIQQLAASNPNLRPVRTPQNMGMPGNANFAVKQSERPYIALLHHDDLYRRDLLERWAEVLDRHPDIAFVFNAFGVHESDFVDREAIHAERVDGIHFLTRFLFPRWGCPVRGTAMVRRTAWETSGGMREQFALLADIDLWMRLSMRWAVGYVPEPLIKVRHARPDYYPNIYNDRTWSWKRTRFLYEVHSRNRQDFLDLGSVSGRLSWWWFRLRLSLETTKWLVYALVKKKPEIISSSQDSETPYDLWPLNLLRALLRSMFTQGIRA